MAGGKVQLLSTWLLSTLKDAHAIAGLSAEMTTRTGDRAFASQLQVDAALVAGVAQGAVEDDVLLAAGVASLRLGWQSAAAGAPAHLQEWNHQLVAKRSVTPLENLIDTAGLRSRIAGDAAGGQYPFGPVFRCAGKIAQKPGGAPTLKKAKHPSPTPYPRLRNPVVGVVVGQRKAAASGRLVVHGAEELYGKPGQNPATAQFTAAAVPMPAGAAARAVAGSDGHAVFDKVAGAVTYTGDGPNKTYSVVLRSDSAFGQLVADVDAVRAGGRPRPTIAQTQLAPCAHPALHATIVAMTPDPLDDVQMRERARGAIRMAQAPEMARSPHHHGPPRVMRAMAESVCMICGPVPNLTVHLRGCLPMRQYQEQAAWFAKAIAMPGQSVCVTEVVGGGGMIFTSLTNRLSSSDSSGTPSGGKVAAEVAAGDDDGDSDDDDFEEPQRASTAKSAATAFKESDKRKAGPGSERIGGAKRVALLALGPKEAGRLATAAANVIGAENTPPGAGQ